MKIQSIGKQDYLWSVSDIFETDLFSQMQTLAWHTQPYDRLEIGLSRRRLIVNSSVPFENQVTDYVKTTLMPCIEKTCLVKFQGYEGLSINWWLDEPGFRPCMHTDGDLPSAMQIYLFSCGHNDLGTCFFHSPNHTDIWHSFSSVPNTGYLMFNAHWHGSERKLLWHDMLKEVPENVYRIGCYITFDFYQKI